MIGLLSRTSQPQFCNKINLSNPITNGICSLVTGSYNYDVYSSYRFKLSGLVDTSSKNIGPSGNRVFSYDDAVLFKTTQIQNTLCNNNVRTIFALVDINTLNDYNSILTNDDTIASGWSLCIGESATDSHMFFSRLIDPSTYNYSIASGSDLISAGDKQVPIIVKFSNDLSIRPIFFVKGKKYNGIDSIFIPSSGSGTMAASSQLYNSMGSVSAAVSRLHGNIHICATFNRQLTDNECYSLSKNPWQLFAPSNKTIFNIGYTAPVDVLFGKGQAEINFGTLGTTGSNEASVVVSTSGIASNSKIDSYIMADDTTTDHTANDHKYLPILAKTTCKVTDPNNPTSLTISSVSKHKLTGKFKIRYVWKN